MRLKGETEADGRKRGKRVAYGCPHLLTLTSTIVRSNTAPQWHVQLSMSFFSLQSLYSFPLSLPSSDASAAAKYDAFVKWLLDNGARFPGLELRVRDVMGWDEGMKRNEEGRG